jgi:hypothetical protein
MKNIDSHYKIGFRVLKRFCDQKPVPAGNVYLLWNAMMIQAVRMVRGSANAK